MGIEVTGFRMPEVWRGDPGFRDRDDIFFNQQGIAPAGRKAADFEDRKTLPVQRMVRVADSSGSQILIEDLCNTL